MISGLILAAGESSRMGSDKALLPYRGSTFLEYIAGTLRASGLERVAVVLGHHADEIRNSVKLPGIEFVVNQDYRIGQTSSLQIGLRALDQPELEAIALSLVDHPAVSSETVSRIIEAFLKTHAPVVIPTHESRRGHPVLLGRELFPELLALSATEGANAVVRKYRAATLWLDVDDCGILIDVDDMDAYKTLPQ